MGDLVTLKVLDRTIKLVCFHFATMELLMKVAQLQRAILNGARHIQTQATTTSLDTGVTVTLWRMNLHRRHSLTPPKLAATVNITFAMLPAIMASLRWILKTSKLKWESKHPWRMNRLFMQFYISECTSTLFE